MIEYPIKDIPDYTFRGCSALQTIQIGSRYLLSDHVLDLTGLSHIGQNAFSLVSSIITIIFSVTQIVLKDGCFSLINVTTVNITGRLRGIKFDLPSNQPFSGCPN